MLFGNMFVDLEFPRTIKELIRVKKKKSSADFLLKLSKS